MLTNIEHPSLLAMAGRVSRLLTFAAALLAFSPLIQANTKTFDVATQRLMGQVVTQDGQTAGNVLNQDAAQNSYTYDGLGNLLSRKDLSPGVNTQEGFSYDCLNRLTLATMLSGAVAPVSNTEVKYDARGNITYKSDVGRYWYDPARPNRMTNVTLETVPGAIQALTGTRALAYAFDDYKAGAQTVGGTTLGNGNLEYTVSHDTVNNRHTVRFESYTSFNMPKDFVYGNFITNTTSTADRTLSFVYGPEHQRIRQNVVLSGNGTSSYFAGNTWYLNGSDSLGLSYEKEVRANGTTEHKHYVGAGGVTFALFTSRTGTLNGLPATTRSYFHHDHLGSIAVVTDELGAATERLAYDPWGKRRFINSAAGTPDTLDAIVGQKTDRGFTMHEHLDEIGIIHMNGRVYDPLIGRFMSADPHVQAPENLQSYNRYAYVINNPLTLTDPSGYFFGWIVAAVAEVFHQVGILDTKTTRTIQAVAIAFETGQWVGTEVTWATAATSANAAAIGAVAGGAAGGFAMGFVSSNGNFEVGLQGAFTGALFGGAGLVGGAEGFDSLERYAAHAGAGCVSAASGGGNCGQGAVSAVFGKFTTNVIGDSTVISGDLAKGIASAVAGGIGSTIAGGKFENGAVTAAYGYLFNQAYSKFQKPGQLCGPEVSCGGGGGSVGGGGGGAAKEAIPAIKAGAAGGETAGKSFSQAIRDAAKGENPLNICVYCRHEGVATQVDHAIPKARGGNATLENAQLACPHCNASKGARDFPVNPPPGYRGEWPPSHWGN